MRLFITSREQQLIADLTKEYVKDVVGQFIYYYPVSTINTQIDPIYDEAVMKIFESPIKIDVVAGQPEQSYTNTQFGLDRTTKHEVMVQSRDLIDKGLCLSVGDFYVYGNATYEINDLIEAENIFGQDDYPKMWKMVSHQARLGQMDANIFKQLLQDSKHYKESQVQKTFQQQRGLSEISSEGHTGDVRQVRQRLGSEMAPIALGEGPREILQEENEQASTFEHNSEKLYDED
jgi:hypothetical protein